MRFQFIESDFAGFMSNESCKHPFDALIESRGESCRLAEAALLFAADADPILEPAPSLKQLDARPRRVEQFGPRGPAERIDALREVLVEQEGFTGNSDDYYDPRNSYLH